MIPKEITDQKSPWVNSYLCFHEFRVFAKTTTSEQGKEETRTHTHTRTKITHTIPQRQKRTCKAVIPMHEIQTDKQEHFPSETIAKEDYDILRHRAHSGRGYEDNKYL